MAVYQGARLRTPALASRDVEGRARAVARPVVAAVPRLRPAGLLIACILAATMIGFAYLTQTLASNATLAELATLDAKAKDYAQQLNTRSWAVRDWADETNVAARARRELGLRELGEPLVLEAP